MSFGSDKKVGFSNFKDHLKEVKFLLFSEVAPSQENEEPTKALGEGIRGSRSAQQCCQVCPLYAKADEASSPAGLLSGEDGLKEVK